MNPYYLEVAFRADERCEYCKAPEIFSNFLFEVEHIIPRSHGGKDEMKNFALACRACNIFKSNYLSGVDDDGNETIRLFNPRTDNWKEHFEISAATLDVVGLSEIGRGTINRLRLNSSEQLKARNIWSKLGFYP